MRKVRRAPGSASARAFSAGKILQSWRELWAPLLVMRRASRRTFRQRTDGERDGVTTVFPYRAYAFGQKKPEPVPLIKRVGSFPPLHVTIACIVDLPEHKLPPAQATRTTPRNSSLETK
jgi:hypothetical protein